MNTLKMTTMLLSLMVLFGIPQNAEASGKSRSSQKMDKLFEELELTDDQQEKIDAIRGEFKTKMKERRQSQKDLRRKIKTERKDLSEKMKTTASNAELRKAFESLQSLHSERHEQRAQGAQLRFENSLEIRDVLNADQRAKFRGFMKERRHSHSGRRGMRGKRGESSGRDDD